MDSHEPMQPSVAVLKRVKTDSVSNPIAITKIFPNPFSNEMNIEFNLVVAQGVSIEIYDIMGNKVYSGPKANYPNGKSSATIQLNILKGNYTLYVKGDNYMCSQNIIRE